MVGQNLDQQKHFQKRKGTTGVWERLKPGDIALLGCLTEGGQGLATANNGKYIAVRRSTKWAKKIIDSRPKKLADAIKTRKIKIEGIDQFANVRAYIDSLSETAIADLFDGLKEKHGRDIFGQGYIYRLIADDEIADVETLTEDEKANGIDKGKKCYVPYDKGDKDGNRWYLETPFAIAWSKENVGFLRADPKARYQGYGFYFREGFCWTDVSKDIKCRLKKSCVFDVLSMSLFTLCDNVPDWYFVCLMNNDFMGTYVNHFVNNTAHFQINDARQIPIIVPTKAELDRFESLFNKAVEIKSKQFSNTISMEESEAALLDLQKEVDDLVNTLYQVI